MTTRASNFSGERTERRDELRPLTRAVSPFVETAGVISHGSGSVLPSGSQRPLVDEEVERRGFMAGSVDVLAKPLQAAALAETARRRLAKGTPRRRVTALILEDDPVAATLTRRMLGDLSIAAQVCSTIAELKGYLSVGKPGLLLLAQQLADGLGTDVCEELRSKRVYDDLPIALMSSNGDRSNRLACLKAGADDFFRKPLTRVELRVRIEALVGGGRPVDAA